MPHSTFGPCYSATETVQLVCISLCRFLKKVSFVVVSLCFVRSFVVRNVCDGERVWTNRQADLGNDKHVLPLSSALWLTSAVLLVTIIYSRLQTKQFLQLQFRKCFYTFPAPNLLFIFFLKDVKLQWIEEFWESCFAYWYEIVKCLKYRYMIVKCLKETAMKLGKRGVQSFIHNRLGLMYM